MMQYIQVITTTEKKADADKIARTLVEKKLAGCVQIIGPISSVYWWEEKTEEANEWLCLIKTTRDNYKNLESTLLEIHPYKIPEILAFPVVAGSNDYLSWLTSVLQKNKK